MRELQWHEPAAYRRAIYYENERKDPLISLKFAGIVFVVMLGLRYFVGLRPDPDAHPPGWGVTAAIAAGVAVFTAYGLPAMMSLMPGSIVILSDKGVNNNVHTGRGWSIRFWPWEEIDHLSAHMDTAGGKAYQVIALHGSDDAALVTLALGTKTTLQDVEEYALRRGKQLAKVAHNR